jgi:aspartyl aminopeptidase
MENKINDFNSELLKFLDSSVTPFHATNSMVEMLREAEFIELNEDESWSLESNKNYFVTRNESSIIAFSYPEFNAQNSSSYGFTMMGAHTDSPNLKIKPSPVIINQKMIQLGVEPYGGVLLNPWFDRDLSIAGRVFFIDENEKRSSAIINFEVPLGIISSLAIHLDKDANKNRTINAQTDIVPLIASGDELCFEAMLMEQLVKEDHTPFKVLSHELSFYDTQKASSIGITEDFIASARLDNLLSCFVSTKTIIESANSETNSGVLMICSDHEEVGSESTSGAAGPFLENVLTRLTSSYEEHMKLLRNSIMISCDNAHAIHPNFTSKHDANHAPTINSGVVIKVNANQRYASNGVTISKFVQAANSINAPLQEFVTRSDMGCGSTIGPITATRLGIDTLDVGLPTFAMHSIRELCGRDDAFSLHKILLQLTQEEQ